jgi:hypothetical protein
MNSTTNRVAPKWVPAVLFAFFVLPLGTAEARHRQAMTTYDDTNPAIVYSQGQNGDGVNGWHIGGNPSDFGGGEHYSAAYSGSFVVHFIGTDFQWIGKKGPNYGIATLFLDGQSVGTVDSYHPTELFQQVLYSTSGLPNEAHVFQMKIGDYPSPAKNPASSYWFQVMDAFVTSGTPLTLPMVSPADNSVTKAGAWSFYINILSGQYCWSNDRSTPGSLTFPFNGTGVEVYGHPEGEDGMMDVYIDGGYATTVDEFNPLYDSILSDANDDTLLYVITGLPAGNHTIQLVVSQSHNPSSLDYYTQIDGFIALPATGGPPPPPPPPGGSPLPAGTYTLVGASGNTVDGGFGYWGGTPGVELYPIYPGNPFQQWTYDNSGVLSNGGWARAMIDPGNGTVDEAPSGDSWTILSSGNGYTVQNNRTQLYLIDKSGTLAMGAYGPGATWNAQSVGGGGASLPAGTYTLDGISGKTVDGGFGYWGGTPGVQLYTIYPGNRFQQWTYDNSGVLTNGGWARAMIDPGNGTVDEAPSGDSWTILSSGNGYTVQNNRTQLYLIDKSGTLAMGAYGPGALWNIQR